MLIDSAGLLEPSSSAMEETVVDLARPLWSGKCCGPSQNVTLREPFTFKCFVVP
jgi:hypothetical protein